LEITEIKKRFGEFTDLKKLTDQFKATVELRVDAQDDLLSRIKDQLRDQECTREEFEIFYKQ
jgi:hypothetical protein